MNLKKIKDAYINSRQFVLGNINDQTNTINRLCPSATAEDYDNIINGLYQAGGVEGQPVSVTLSTTEEFGDFVYQIKSMFLIFDF